jgi:kumamolisin
MRALPLRICVVTMLAISCSHSDVPVEPKKDSATVPATDLSSANDSGKKASTTYLIRGAGSPQGNSPSGIIVPDSDFRNLTAFDAQMQSVPQKGVSLKQLHAHTNYLIFGGNAVRPMVGTVQDETPDSIRGIYTVAAVPSNPVADVGSRVIAIVDAFNYPTAENDLAVFSANFSLKQCKVADGCLRILYQGGTKPPNNCAWSGEAALDLEWAHAMAPNAKLIFVEAHSDSFSDLFSAVQIATHEVASAGGGEVSLSWGGVEFPDETKSDRLFNQSGVTFFVSSGDVGGIHAYPAASPNVVSVGGTTIIRNAAGAFVEETAWSGSGGGPSGYEGRPAYQVNVVNASPTQRSVPDVAVVADPETGVAVYNSTVCQNVSGWMVVGGTSAGAPIVAGMANAAGHFNRTSADELNAIYSHRQDPTSFRDVVKGSAGPNPATIGYDFATGIGSPLGKKFDEPSIQP